MDTILSALRSIVLAASGAVAVVVLVAGVEVRRSSLTGFDVAGRRGLDAVEAMQAIEATIVDAPLPAAVKAPRSARAVSFFAVVVDAVKGLPALGSRTLRNATTANGDRVAVSCSAGRGCSADEHRSAALVTAAGLRLLGLRVELDGSTAMVIA